MQSKLKQVKINLNHEVWIQTRQKQDKPKISKLGSYRRISIKSGYLLRIGFLPSESKKIKKNQKKSKKIKKNRKKHEKMMIGLQILDFFSLTSSTKFIVIFFLGLF